YYQPDYFATTEPFLILNALIYIAIAVRYAYQQAPHLTHYAEGMLIFGVPLIGFGLQVALVKDFEYGSAWSSAVLAAFYLLLARWLHARQRESLHLLIESFLALGVIFATLTLPLALDARWTSAAWALEGAGVFWLGMRQQRQLARLFGLLLQILAALALLKPYEAVAVYPLVNAPFLGSLLMALAGWFIHRQIVKPRDDTVASPGEQSLAPLLFLWSLGWWLAAGWGDIERFIDAPHRLTALLAFATATVATFGPLYLRWQWREAAWPFLAFLPTLAILALAMAAAHDHPFAAYGWLVWPLALATHVWLLRKLQPEAPTFYFGLLHSATLLFLAALGAWEMHWLAGQFGPRYSAWSVCSVIGIPCLLLLTACSQRLATRWPLVDYEKSYLQDAGRVILVGLWLWVFYANFSHDGAMPPLPYLPLINVLDLGHILILLTVLKWRQWAKRCDFEVSVGPAPLIAISLASFVWVNAALLRTLHHWAAIPYRFDDLMRSVLVQTSLSIFWTLLALGAMLAGTKKQLRPIWFAGAGLMAVVVGKLFLVDLSNIGGILRIVSFIGVGVLMLVIGYIAPLPPAMTDAANEQERNP
ncbi:MAG: DUF2339 domain-containing protein, partial [Betaproteobacteria bacterium]|nr:DUF2339 domain-containing protein [Betaproteobacteria bacterium]